MSKYTRLIDVICFDHVTRFLCSHWLKCCITLQCDMSSVITLSVWSSIKLLTTKALLYHTKVS